MSNIAEETQDLCHDVLWRALFAMQLNAFGEDGMGQHGQCEHPQYFSVLKVRVAITEVETELFGVLFLVLHWYNSSVLSVCTDRNFEISLAQVLKNAGIDPTALKLLPHDRQPMKTDMVMFEIDIPKLLKWA